MEHWNKNYGGKRLDAGAKVTKYKKSREWSKYLCFRVPKIYEDEAREKLREIVKSFIERK
jgi:hypothetical protein